MTEVKSVVEPDSVGNDIGWGRLAGICDACVYSSTDSINLGQLSCQHPGRALLVKILILQSRVSSKKVPLIRPIHLSYNQKYKVPFNHLVVRVG